MITQTLVETTQRQMRFLVERGLQGVESLPLADRIALHRAVAYAFCNLDPAFSENASYTAHLLAEAERHQMQFKELLKSAS